MEYAAIIIPTLNRKNHLERCIKSLQRNQEAIYTDLYISVDYPPSKKYEDGYDAVVSYVKTITGFASINLFFQEKNLGPGLNRSFLEKQIESSHDKYVFTDDDNEFSDNFLAYVNWGLEKYKNDERIYAICSCTDFDISHFNMGNDYFAIRAYNPYGSGHWLHKNKKCRDYLKQENLNLVYKNKKNREKLYKYSPMVYMWVAHDSLRKVSAMRGRDDGITYIDIWENVYIIENDMFCIKPISPKSRNWGLDGSGVHAADGEKKDYSPEIDLDSSNKWCDKPLRAEDEEFNFTKIHRDRFRITQSEKKKSDIIYIINSIFGNKIVYKVYKKYKNVFSKNTSHESEVKYG